MYGNIDQFSDVINTLGLKALKKFKRLMLHRIQWNPRKRGEGEMSDMSLLILLLHIESGDSDNEASSSKKKKKNTCTLVWEVSIMAV